MKGEGNKKRSKVRIRRRNNKKKIRRRENQRYMRRRRVCVSPCSLRAAGRGDAASQQQLHLG